MNIFEYITLNQLYAKVVNDLPLSPSNKNDVINWIGESTEFIYTNSVLMNYDKVIHIKDYMCECPCNTIDLLGVFEGNRRVHFNNSQSHISYLSEIEENTYILGEEHNELNYYKNQSLHKLEKLNKLTNNTGLTYSKRGKFLHFNFEKGNAHIFYKSLPKNTDDEFLYPDEINYKECIVAWVQYKAIIKGIIKGNENNALQSHNSFKHKAIGAIEFPSPEVMQSIVDNNFLFKNNNYDLIL